MLLTALRGFNPFKCRRKWQGQMTEGIHITQTRRQREQRGEEKRQRGRWRERGQWRVQNSTPRGLLPLAVPHIPRF